jgi:hypothetical protein
MGKKPCKCVEGRVVEKGMVEEGEEEEVEDASTRLVDVRQCRSE